MVRGSVVLVGVLVAVASVLGGCSDDDDGDSARAPVDATTVPEATSSVLKIEATGAGEAYKYVAPATVAAGVVEIQFTNSAGEPHDAQLIRVDGSHSVDEAVKIVTTPGGPIPEWLTGAGGVAHTPPGATESATVGLAEGTYYFVDVDTPQGADDEKTFAERGLRSALRVTAGSNEGDLPTAEFTIVAKEHSFVLPPLEAGRNRIEFRNTGAENHHVVAFPLRPGKTVDDLKNFLSTQGPPTGPPPFDATRMDETAVIAGGRREIAELNLHAGEYGFVCFINDRAGGPPHFTKGMLTSATVS